ncbi:helix-turn-helix domain-containing protein [Leptospira congkakensis]|uniref:Helix-turn-helix domain-containing protein n=1 Tax=Leptospira congkakensis TaxID=2484932 RepID=A0A4Z1A3R5_9LEPT|nr:GyrI-like domain-containing protein [Leptospira congkakensis]TGL88636.1 helix-turn-helix domain-containing protein [Leptospira congkakensis]TGL89222.1 helix-turn-helix domain-containing protein [Leptospira congkakensis]TGL97190.1 helix-turn-helix domain-containing protein [Leptospira congkakensis]
MPQKPDPYPIWNLLEGKLDDTIGLGQIAFFTGYSDWHFHRLFKSIQGENVKEYIRRLRLEKAAYELKITNFPILEIAIEAGFLSHEAFSKAFKRVIGITPSEFRKKYQKKKTISNKVHQTLPDGISKFGFQKKTISTFSIAFVRHIGSYEELPGPIAGSNEVKQIQSLIQSWNSSYTNHKWIGISQDDPEISPKGKIRFDLGITVGSLQKKLIQGFGVQSIPGGKYLQIRYQGKYQGLPKIYDWILNDYTKSNSLKLKNQPPWECYLNPLEKDDDKRLTDIYIPLT